MADWLEWARGPAFRACLLIMLLGLVRVLALTAVATFRLIRKSRKNGREIPWVEIVAATLSWLFPIKRGLKGRGLFSLTSMVFHVAIIVTPIFLGAQGGSVLAVDVSALFFSL